MVRLPKIVIRMLSISRGTRAGAKAPRKDSGQSDEAPAAY